MKKGIEEREKKNKRLQRKNYCYEAKTLKRISASDVLRSRQVALLLLCVCVSVCAVCVCTVSCCSFNFALRANALAPQIIFALKVLGKGLRFFRFCSQDSTTGYVPYTPSLPLHSLRTHLQLCLRLVFKFLSLPWQLFVLCFVFCFAPVFGVD